MTALVHSPLNKIMDNSNTALWTIPKFDFGDFYQFVSEIPKKSIYIYK